MSGNIVLRVKQVGLTDLDAKSLRKVRDLIKDEYPQNAETLNQALASTEQNKTILWVSEGLLIQLGFWVMMVMAYPRYRQVQAIFFWNPWVRKLLGLGYVGFLLTWSPRLRRRLLSPFLDVLLIEARLDEFEETAYFPDSLVKTPDKQLRPLSLELSTLHGQVLLEGDSGLGKTSFIRQHLA